MDGLSNQFNGTLKRQWRRRQYRRLDGTIPKRKKVKVVRFGGGGGGGGGGGSSRRRLWRIRAVPKLQLLKVASPAKLWSKLKNAYINMMLHLAGNVSGLNGGEHAFAGKRISEARPVPLSYSKDEFERRLVFEIFKSLMASKELGTTTTMIT